MKTSKVCLRHTNGVLRIAQAKAGLFVHKTLSMEDPRTLEAQREDCVEVKPKRRRSKKNSPPTPQRKLMLSNQSLWCQEKPQPHIMELLKQLNSMGQRPTFSLAERRSIARLYHYLKSKKRQVTWQASAASVPLWPASFLFSCWAILVSLVGLLNSWWGILLGALLGLAIFWEWQGTFRASQLFFAPRGSHYLTLQGGDPTASQTLVLCVGIDTPSGDPIYQPDSFKRLRFLHRQSLTPATLLLLCVGTLPLILFARWWSSYPAIHWLYWSHLGSLTLACLVFYLSAHKQEQEGPCHVSVATIFEVFDRLEKIELPIKTKLVLLGASAHGVGMESWLRQHKKEHPPEETYILSIAPYSRDANTLLYRTHEGILRREVMHPNWVEAAEQTAMRFARETGWSQIPTPQRRFGSSITETAHRFGYPSMTLGATFQTEERSVGNQELTEATTTSSVMDSMAGWCVAVVQSLVKQQISPESPSKTTAKHKSREATTA